MKRRSLIPILLCLFCLLSACGEPQETPPTEETENPAVHLALTEDGSHPQLVAHAGGAIYGYRLTNSLEALNNAYENGFRYIELDFSYTSDGSLVLIHDWDGMAARLLPQRKQYTLEEYRAAETFAGLTLMDLEMLLSWLDAHQDCVIITDIKSGNDPFLEDLYTQAGDQVRQFIPQAYSYEDYHLAQELGYPSVILTLYQMPGVDRDALISFAQTSQPWAIVMSDARLDLSVLKPLAAQGIPVYAHSVNDLSYFESWRDLGLTGIYTDHFIPKMWPY